MNCHVGVTHALTPRNHHTRMTEIQAFRPDSARRAIFEWRGLASGVVFLPVVIAAGFSRPWIVDGSEFDVAAKLLAWLALGSGIVIRLWATLYIGGRKSTELVRSGPYALCRHPLYVASFLIAASLAGFLQSASILAAALALAAIYATTVIPSEERHVLGRFGNAYRAYARATPRFIPRVQSFQRPGVISVKIASVLRELARSLALIVLGALIDGTHTVRHQHWWPAPFHLP
jgi:protein-S-isoprenylcysteine O-methyltransferase Ste14